MSLPFILSTDACMNGLGAVLSQVQQGKERVIAYASRATNKQERNYGITQLEGLAIVWGIEKFRPYLKDQRFRVITDHKALTSFPHIGNKNPQLERWSVKLSEYDFEVQYRPGTFNKVADAMSRTPIENVNIIVERREWIETYRDDPNWKDIYIKLENVKENDIIKNNPEFKIDDIEIIRRDRIELDKEGILWINNKGMRKMIVPQKMVPTVLKLCHEPSHFAVDKTWNKVKTRFHWRKAYRDTIMFVRSCLKCQRRNKCAWNNDGPYQDSHRVNTATST
eukprot:TRINITY_DN5178_c0_g2_i3.p1 TRINITY_DN5178_c0_g2~~TRINITY_DN5178_c0_g2_i3.p1  ORF type:complete len:280 (+),score=-8.18 TRINITY_DN5178_c0_g2_i3:314-1153(+)